MPLSTASSYCALANMIAAAGPLLVGVWSNKLSKRGIERTPYLSAGNSLSALGAGLVMVLCDNAPAAIAAMILWQFLIVSLSAPNFATLLTVTPPETRGTVMAALTVCIYFLGVGTSSWFAGLLSDEMGGGAMLCYALAVQLDTNLLWCCSFLMAARAIRRMVRDVS